MTDGASSLAAPVYATATITNIALTANVVTFTATNTFVVGQQVKIAGVTTSTFLNNQVLTVASSNGSTFTAAFTHANVTSGADSGTATFVSLSQFTYGGLTSQGTYFTKVTYVTAGGETLPSLESSLAVSDGNELIVSPPPSVASAIGWNVYVGKATGTEIKQNFNLLGFGQPFVLDTFRTVGSAVPSSNTAGSAAVGINISGNFATFTAPAASEIQFSYDSTTKQAMMNPSNLAFNFIRARKSATTQTLRTIVYLFGQQG
jgi:galactitol-specific phosphotransferase system IIB component